MASIHQKYQEAIRLYAETDLSAVQIAKACNVEAWKAWNVR